MSAAIEYRSDVRMTVEQFVDVLERSTLGRRRPIADRACMASMIENANLIVTAWDGETLVGVARSVTDFSYACYLSDLAVDTDYQRRGIGRELIHRTRAALGPRCKIRLIAAPEATNFYRRLGFEHNERCWQLA